MEINEYLSYKAQENNIHIYDIILDGAEQITLTLVGKELEHPYENGLKLFRGGFINANQSNKNLNDNIRFCEHDWESAYDLYCSFADIFAKYYSNYKVSVTIGNTVTAAISFCLSEVQNPDRQSGQSWPCEGRIYKYNFDNFYAILPALDVESGNPDGKISVVNLLDYQIEAILDDGVTIWTKDTPLEG